MGPIWWVRMARWARNPPSKRYVQIVLVVVGCAALIVLADWLFNPDFGERTMNLRRGPVINATPIEAQ